MHAEFRVSGEVVNGQQEKLSMIVLGSSQLWASTEGRWVCERELTKERNIPARVKTERLEQ